MDIRSDITEFTRLEALPAEREAEILSSIDVSELNEVVAIFKNDQSCDLYLRTESRWFEVFVDDGENVVATRDPPVPDWVSAEMLPAFMAAYEFAFREGHQSGVAAGRAATENKVKYVGKMLFGDVLEDAIYGALKSAGMAHREY